MNGATDVTDVLASYVDQLRSSVEQWKDKFCEVVKAKQDVVAENERLRADLASLRVYVNPLPIHGCDCGACAYLRRMQQEERKP